MLPLRVLLWSEVYLPHLGGSTLFADRLRADLESRDVEFLVMADGRDSNGGVVRLPFYETARAHDPTAWLQLKKECAAWVGRFKPDLVHMNGLGPGTPFYLGCPAFKPIPLLVTVHGEMFASLEGRPTPLQQTLAGADWVSAPSAATLAHARRLAGSAGPGGVIYNGVEFPARAVREFPQRPTILCLARLAAEKGVDRALRTVAEVSRRFPDLRLILAGSGPECQNLKGLSRRLGLEQRVDWRGRIEPGEVASLIEEASLTLMPSRSEGLPIAALESQALGRPVVATPVGGLPEAVIHGQTGLVVPPEQLTSAVESLLADPARLVRLGRAAREHVRRSFPWSKTLDGYERLYRVLEGGRRRSR